MPTPQVYQLHVGPITAFSFNSDRSKIAISPNSTDLDIYAKKGPGYTKIDTLGDHDKLVTSVDWAPQSNRIVTCSQDRNAYVWESQSDGSWKPTLVLLRLNRAATFVRWSPHENKFACGSSARAISVCSFDEEGDWWVSKHLKKPIRSTILSVDWHPNNVLLAAGGADSKARVFSAFIKDVDKRPEPTVWGTRLPFNTLCAEYSSPAGGWVHSVAFSPSGDALAFVSHDSSVTIAYPAGPEEPPRAVISVRTPLLPFLSLLWINENEIAAAGHDCQPILFSGSDQGWKMGRSLDDTAKSMSSRESETSAFNMFRNMDRKGTAKAASEDTTLPTVHQNTITCEIRDCNANDSMLRAFEGGAGGVSKVASSGLDGKIVVWDVGGSGLEGRLGGMNIRR